MQRFRNILVLVPSGPEAERVVGRAAELAERNGARLTLYDVVPELAGRQARVDQGGRSVDLQGLLAAGRRQELEELAAAAGDATVEVAIDAGETFAKVVERVLEEAHDLVITVPDRETAGRGRGGPTTTLHLLRKSPVPVWVDDPASWQRRDVLVAVGPFPDDGAIGELDRTLLQLGSSLALIQGGDLHVVHAWRLEGEMLFRGGKVRLPADEVDALVDAERVAAENSFSAVIAEVAQMGIAPIPHLREGRAAEVIGDVVSEVKPGVVVMGTLARSGIRGLLIGNTAERILDDLDASVIAAKPPGFVSPVAG